jgi:hypothetical protein
VPPGRLCDALRLEQDVLFFGYAAALGLEPADAV